MISTRDLSALPAVDELRRLLQSLAVLDAILSPEWDGRYYSFDAAWSDGEQMGSMRDGSGNEFFAHFSEAGCWLKGFAHESPMSPSRTRPPTPWPGVVDSVPSEFTACLSEPAFNIEDVTFCIWRQPTDPTWQVGPIAFPTHADPDGSAMLLSILDGRPKSYQAFATDYYEVDVKIAAIKHVYQHKPLTAELVSELNPDVKLRKLNSELREIGYPLATK